MSKNLFPFHNPFKIKVKYPSYYLKNKYLKDKHIDWKSVKLWSLRIFIGLFVVTLLLFAWYAKDLPTPGNIKHRQAAASTQIFDRNGKPLYVFSGDVKRILIDKNEIPDSIKKATITAEDRSFYHHFGFNVKGILRALYYNVTGKTGYISGGSTITQQYVKTALLDPKKTLTRKIKELILSIEIEIMYSKDDILGMYLNEIPYGSNAYGVQAAAQTFFNKDAKDLTLAESATLAALPQRPTYFSPYGTHPDKRLARVNWVLDSMADLGYISKDEAEKAKGEAKDIKFAEPKQYITAPHFVMYVKEQLVEKYGEQMVEEGGLKVTTTLDLDKQKIADEVVKDSASRLNNINASNAALVSIDPKTGQILSMIGSIDFFNKDIDGQVNVTDSPRQPGSAFKPIVYATAFKGKYNPGYTLWDVTTDFGNYTPKNYDGNTHGPVTMRQALAGSLNIPAVKTLALAGLDKSLATAKDMGITTLNDRDRYGLSLVLGGGEVRLVELAGAYGVFANQGKLAPTTAILKVESSNGKILEEYKEDTKEAIDPQIAYEISSILADNDARSYVFGSRSALYLGDRPAAAKTGTTSSYRDAWTVGYTPQLVTGVWVGNNNNKEMAAGSAGAMAAAPIWNSYMKRALEGQPVEDFIQPSGINRITVDKLSNKLPTDASPETVTDLFSTWQAPKDKDDIHISVRIDKATGNLATDSCPDSSTEMRTYTNLHSEMPDNPSWENPVRAAAQAMGITISYPPKEQSCSASSSRSKIRITSPSNNSNVGSSFTVNVDTDSGWKVDKVEFYIDNKRVDTDSSAPYSTQISNLSKGKHKITVVGSERHGSSSSDSVTVTVGSNNDSAPDDVTINSINPDIESATISWTNPKDSDLEAVKVYLSTSRGDLGDNLSTVRATPSSTSSIEISDLESGQTYYVTLRAVDNNGNENDSRDQTSFEPL